MDILDEYARYTCPAGLISGYRDPSQTSGNSILFTAQMLCVLRQNRISMVDLMDITEAKIDAIKAECQIVPGLFRRGKRWPDQEGPDDYVGLACVDPQFAKDVLEYGRSHKFHWGPFRFPYYFQNESPGINNDGRAWLGRQQQLIAHWQYGAGEKVPFWRKLFWQFSIETSGKFGPDPRMPGGQDAWILSAMLLELHWDSNSAEVFYRLLDKTWPGGMREVFAVYFQDEDHPTAKYWIEKRS